MRLGQLDQVLLGRGSYMPKSVEWPDKKTFAGNVSGAYSFSAQAAEIEIDRDTGKTRVSRLILGDDCGFPLNPMSGVWLKDLPITPEKLLQAIEEKGE